MDLSERDCVSLNKIQSDEIQTNRGIKHDIQSSRLRNAVKFMTSRRFKYQIL